MVGGCGSAAWCHLSSAEPAGLVVDAGLFAAVVEEEVDDDEVGDVGLSAGVEVDVLVAVGLAAVDFVAVDLAAAFLAGAFFAGAFLAGAFLAGAFLAGAVRA